MSTDISIAELPTLPAASVQGDDIVPIVDVHDLTDPTGTTKGTTVTSLTYPALPRGGRTTSTLATYLANNAVFNVMDYGAKGDGTTDDTAAIQAALTAAAGTNGVVYLPPGTYVISAALTMPANTTMTGVLMQSTIKPSSSFSTGCAVTVGSYCLLERLSFDGTNTTGGSAVGVGAIAGGTITSSPRVRDLWIQGFDGAATSAGLQVGNAVDASLRNIWSSYNNYGMYVVSGTGGCPTASVFEDLYFHENLNQGCWIQAGSGLVFLGCIFEASYNEGLYIYNASTPALDVNAQFLNCWFEQNWLSLAGNASRANQYSAYVRGVNGQFSPYVTFKNCQMAETPGTGAPKAIRLTDARNFVLENMVRMPNVATILIDGTSFGNITNWLDIIGGAEGIQDARFGNQITNTSTGIVYIDGQVYGSAAPVSGTYKVGQVVWNTVPASGGPMGWVCTTGGSPGTWSSFGNIANAANHLLLSGATTTGTTQRGATVSPTGDGTDTTAMEGVYVQPATAATSYTVTTLRGVHVNNATKGAGSTITTQVGLEIDALSSGTTNYAIRTNGGLHSLGGALTVTGGGAAITGNSSITGSLAVSTGFGCNGATPQTAAASGGALAAYASGTAGLDTGAHMQALYNLVVAMRAALVANGIMS